MRYMIALLMVLVAAPAFADYTVDIKNASGTVIKTYVVTSDQVLHLNKVHARTGKTVLNQFKEAILDLIAEAQESNKAAWKVANDAYIEGVSKD